MTRREFYSTVDLGGRALVVRSRIGGGFTKVADCRSLTSAQRLGHATNKSIAQATQLLRDAAGPEEDEPCT